MTSDDYARLAYLVLLLVAVGGYFLVANRHRLGQVLQQASIWALIFVGVIAAAGLWGDIRQEVIPRQTVVADQGIIELPRAPDGHFYLTAQVNGAPIRFVVDTGATSVVLSRQDATRAGIDIERLVFTGQARTANGMVRTAPTRLANLEVGGITDQNVRAWVNQGELDGSLLGMTYLDRFDKVVITRDSMVLTR